MKKFFLSFFVGIFLTACAATVVPETALERYVAADGAYKALVLTVQDGVRQGLIKGEGARDVKLSLNSARAALDIWALIPNDANAETVALVSLSALRVLLRSVRPVSIRGSPDRFAENIFEGVVA